MLTCVCFSENAQRERKKKKKKTKIKIKIIYLFIYLRSLGAKSQEKLNRGNSYIATSNRETLTDDKRRRIT